MNDLPEETEKKGLVIFGRDVSKMPCFRNSYLYGIGGGLGSGLVYFMFTSRTQAACHAGMIGFTLITLGYWSQCRYAYSKTKFEMLKVQELIRNQNIYEGSETEKSLNDKLTVHEV